MGERGGTSGSGRRRDYVSSIFFFILHDLWEISTTWIFYRSKADGELEWKPSDGDENTKSTKKKPTRKRRKTQTKGFPQENDLVEIDFGEEKFEAVVLDAGATLIDIKYTVDGSCEFVDRNDLVPRNMVLLKRPEVGSKVEKEFDSPTKKKGKKNLRIL